MIPMKSNPADATIWVENKPQCPVCGSPSSFHIIKQGFAQQDLMTNEWQFATSTPQYYAYCANCHHLVQPDFDIRKVVKEWQKND